MLMASCILNLENGFKSSRTTIVLILKKLNQRGKQSPVVRKIQRYMYEELH